MADLDALRKALGAEVSDDVLAKVSKLVETEQAKVEKAKLDEATRGASHLVKEAIGKAIKADAVANALNELGELVGREKSYVVTIPYANQEGFDTRTGSSIRTSGGGGGGKSKVKDLTGKSPAQWFDELATPEQKAEFDVIDKADGNARFTYKDKAIKQWQKDGLIPS